jgi:hypothetical protein
MSSATFSADRHIYESDGVIVPSVTQALALAGIDDISGIPLHYLERAAGIGLAVHQACEFLDQDDLELESVEPSIVGYVLAYQRFRQETGFTPAWIEHRTIGDVDGLKYGMCIDRFGEFEGRPTLIDLKTPSKKQNWWGVQLAAYAVGLSDRIDFPGCARMNVHLAKDGSYKLIRHEDERDFEVWWAALRVAYWKLEHGTKLPR